MRNKVELAFAVFLVFIDYAAIVLAGIVAYWLRTSSIVTDIRDIGHITPLPAYSAFVVLVGIVCIPIFALAGMYRMRRTRRIVDELRRTFLGCSTGILGVIVLIVFIREQFASRFLILVAWGLAILFVFFGRLIVLLIERMLYLKGIGVHRVVVVGGDKTTRDLVREFRAHPTLGYHVVHHVERVTQETPDALERLYTTKGFDEIVQADANLDRDLTEDILAFAEERHVAFKYIADLFSTHARNITMDTIVGIPIVEIRRTRLDGWGRIWKRCFDVGVAALMFAVLSPFLALIALAIKLDSRGPIFFDALDDGSPTTRVGERGLPFRYFKFRTMHPGTHALRYTDLAKRNLRKGGPLVKIKNDPRITSLGRLLRRFSIDELPELLLVLRGDMSLVGPRPHLPEEVEQYARHHKRVLSIKPGITGLAQISGRSDLSFEEEVRLDTYYIENWSIWLDLYILLKTPFAVLGKRKAE